MNTKENYDIPTIEKREHRKYALRSHELEDLDIILTGISTANYDEMFWIQKNVLDLNIKGFDTFKSFCEQTLHMKIFLDFTVFPITVIRFLSHVLFALDHQFTDNGEDAKWIRLLFTDPIHAVSTIRDGDSEMYLKLIYYYHCLKKYAEQLPIPNKYLKIVIMIIHCLKNRYIEFGIGNIDEYDNVTNDKKKSRCKGIETYGSCENCPAYTSCINDGCVEEEYDDSEEESNVDELKESDDNTDLDIDIMSDENANTLFINSCDLADHYESCKECYRYPICKAAEDIKKEEAINKPITSGISDGNKVISRGNRSTWCNIDELKFEKTPSFIGKAKDMNSSYGFSSDYCIIVGKEQVCDKCQYVKSCKMSDVYDTLYERIKETRRKQDERTKIFPTIDMSKIKNDLSFMKKIEECKNTYINRFELLLLLINKRDHALKYHNKKVYSNINVLYDAPIDALFNMSNEDTKDLYIRVLYYYASLFDQMCKQGSKSAYFAIDCYLAIFGRDDVIIRSLNELDEQSLTCNIENLYIVWKQKKIVLPK